MAPLDPRPSRDQLLAARDRGLADVVKPGLRVLLVGINPSLYSAAVGHHFARPGNRFWKALYAGRITPHVLSPFEDRRLLALGYGLTNLVARATATAAELAPEDLVRGRRRLERLIRRLRPRMVAFLGVTAFRQAYARPGAVLGPQTHTIEGSTLWVLPNPSGLNAHHQVADLGRWFARLHAAAVRPPRAEGDPEQWGANERGRA